MRYRMIATPTLLLLVALITAGYVPPPPMPSDIPKVDALTVLEDYTNNEERANRDYKGKWFTIRGTVDRGGFWRQGSSRQRLPL